MKTSPATPTLYAIMSPVKNDGFDIEVARSTGKKDMSGLHWTAYHVEEIALFDMADAEAFAARLEDARVVPEAEAIEKIAAQFNEAHERRIASDLKGYVVRVRFRKSSSVRVSADSRSVAEAAALRSFMRDSKGAPDRTVTAPDGNGGYEVKGTWHKSFTVEIQAPTSHIARDLVCERLNRRLADTPSSVVATLAPLPEDWIVAERDPELDQDCDYGDPERLLEL